MALGLVRKRLLKVYLMYAVRISLRIAKIVIDVGTPINIATKDVQVVSAVDNTMIIVGRVTVIVIGSIVFTSHLA